jgi:hypothetical protein
MTKLQCPCGHVHDLSPIPDDGWVIVADRDYEALVEAERRQAAGGEGGPEAFVRLTGRLYECPACGRIMWERPDEKAFRIFRPEA